MYVLTHSGDIYSWGDGACGELGHGNNEDQLVPKRIEALQGIKIVDIIPDTVGAFVLTKDGEVYSWGDGGAFLTEPGGIYSLGHGDCENQLSPKLVNALQGIRIKKIYLGDAYSYTYALSSCGGLYAWGCAYNGKSGADNREILTTPIRLPALKDKEILNFSIQTDHTHKCCAAITSEGEMYVWHRMPRESGATSTPITTSDPTFRFVLPWLATDFENLKFWQQARDISQTRFEANGFNSVASYSASSAEVFPAASNQSLSASGTQQAFFGSSAQRYAASRSIQGSSSSNSQGRSAASSSSTDTNFSTSSCFNRPGTCSRDPGKN